MQNTRQNLGAIIRAAREAEGMTLLDVCRKMDDLGKGMAPTKLEAIENGDFSVRYDDLAMIAEALGKVVTLSPLPTLPRTEEGFIRRLNV